MTRSEATITTDQAIAAINVLLKYVEECKDEAHKAEVAAVLHALEDADRIVIE